jgi:hypothetical protein
MSKTVGKNFDNWIYCYITSIPIIQKFNNTNTKPDDYAVYKIGKTKRTIEERMNEHGDRVDKLLFNKKVYDCDTIETDLINFLKADKNLKKRKNLTNKKKDEKKEKGDTGLEYFEGRYIHIKPYLDKVISEQFQCSKPRKMDIDNICQICQKKVATEGGLKTHMSRMHNIKSQPKASSSRVKVSRVSPSRVSPSRVSPSRVSPPKSSSSRVSPPKISPSRVSPPKSSLKYQSRATKQPSYIIETINRKAPLYNISKNSNSSSNSNFLELMKKLKLNNKRNRSNRSSLSRSPNLRSNKRPK